MLCYFLVERSQTLLETCHSNRGYLVEVLTQKGAIVRIKKANAILKRPANKLFRIEYTNHDTNQADKKAREQKLR